MRQKEMEVVIIGAGNLATNLGLALVKAGIRIPEICNRTKERGVKLAKKTNAVYISDVGKLMSNADIYICSVTDQALSTIVKQLHLKDKLVVHTSGTLEMDILNTVSSNYGVIYPLQTFVSSRRQSFTNIPVCIEGNNEAAEKMIMDLAAKLSRNVHVIESSKRKMLHLSAVFAGNFTNFLYTIAEDLLARYQLPLDLLQPLVVKTSHNLQYHDLFQFQTGPALREDANVVEEHKKLLKNDQMFQEIYALMTDSIIRYKHSHGKL